MSQQNVSTKTAEKSTKDAKQTGEVILDLTDLKVHFPVKAQFFSRDKEDKVVKAVDGISLTVREGQTIGLAGESGCGKSTLARTLVKLEEPTSGKVVFKGQNLQEMTSKDNKAFRSEAQMIFQDPYESLNPRFSIRQTLEEGLIIHEKLSRKEREERVLETLTMVGLRPAESYIDRYPHELSGGQRQRVAIARALVLNPTFLIADEPVSMLDVSIRASILNLIKQLVDELNVAGIYISHDLSLIRYVCEDTGIMYLGRIVEYGDTEELIQNPLHPYTKALLDAVPSPDPRLAGITVHLEDEAPSPIDLPTGCRFHPRCPMAMDICRTTEPHVNNVDGRLVECHLYNDDLEGQTENVEQLNNEEIS